VLENDEVFSSVEESFFVSYLRMVSLVVSANGLAAIAGADLKVRNSLCKRNLRREEMFKRRGEPH
jgi:hypothetical protein